MTFHASQSVVPPELSEELKPVKEDGTGRRLKEEAEESSTENRRKSLIVQPEHFNLNFTSIV